MFQKLRGFFMVKKALITGLILNTGFLLGMEGLNGYEPRPIKCHIMSKVENCPFFINCKKYYINSKKGLPAFYATSSWYKTENFFTARTINPVFNIRPNSFGILEVKDVLLTHVDKSLLSIIYCWNTQTEKLSIHFDGQQYRDKKSFNIPTNWLDNDITIILQGDFYFEDSSIFPGKPENLA